MDTAQELDVFARNCPTREVLGRITDKWTTLVITFLCESAEPVRFNVLRRQIEGISQKMLTQTLRDLERDGLVVRAVYPVIPPHVEYSLTPLGRTLDAILRQLAHWAAEHGLEVRAAQDAFDARIEPGRHAPAAQPLARPSVRAV
jgi:DNA-binding HxlR family transcriptional regulator